MKGKKILSLVSLALGVAIVGGTFAAWAVTDNADPFGIKVSPGQVGPDTTQYATLSYGGSTFANVDNLKAGEPRVAGSVLLKSDTSDGTPFPFALFKIELKDQSAAKSEGVAKLVNLLKVDVYEKEVEIKNKVVVEKGTETPAKKIGYIPVDSELKASIPVSIPSGTGLTVSAVVSLDASTDAKTLEEIASDVVYLEMNLDKDDSKGPYVTASKLYLNKVAGEGYDMYCYAWNATNKNAAWPGIKMTAENGASVYELNNEFDKLVFNMSKKVGEEWQTDWQTVDLDITGAIRTTTPTFTPNNTAEEGGKFSGSWGAAPDPEIVVGYYVVGNKKGNWSPAKANLMTVDPDDNKHYRVDLALEAGELLKVTNQNKTVWFSSISTWDGCGFTIDASGNIVVTTAGNYTVNLFTEGSGGNCVTLTPKASA